METPIVTRGWCPGCQPDVDPLRELVIEQWCATHHAPTSGLDDARSAGPCVLSGVTEIDPETNRQWAQLLRRRPLR